MAAISADYEFVALRAGRRLRLRPVIAVGGSFFTFSDTCQAVSAQRSSGTLSVEEKRLTPRRLEKVLDVPWPRAERTAQWEDFADDG